jgi:rhodanese-related sulfurtransferase
MLFSRIALLIVLALASSVYAGGDVVSSLIPYAKSLGSLLPEHVTATAQGPEHVTFDHLFDVYRVFPDRVTILDTSDPKTYMGKHILGAHHVEVDFMEQTLPYLRHNYPIYVYGTLNTPKTEAVANIIAAAGFSNVYWISEHIITGWKGKTASSEAFYRISSDKLIANDRFKKMHIIDVRSPDEYAAKHIPNSVNMRNPEPQDYVWAKEMLFVGVEEEFAQNRCIIAGNRGAIGCFYLEGGFEAWKGPYVRS